VKQDSIKFLQQLENKIQAAMRLRKLPRQCDSTKVEIPAVIFSR
jgi:hypothetical protein